MSALKFIWPTGVFSTFSPIRTSTRSFPIFHAFVHFLTLCLYKKRNLHGSLKICILFSPVKSNIFCRHVISFMPEELRGVLNEVLLQRLRKYFNAMASDEMTEKKAKVPWAIKVNGYFLTLIRKALRTLVPLSRFKGNEPKWGVRKCWAWVCE